MYTKEYTFIHLGILCTEQRSDSQPSNVELGESRGVYKASELKGVNLMHCVPFIQFYVLDQNIKFL